MPDSPYIKVKQPGTVASMSRTEMLDLHWQKDRYIDKLHDVIRDMRKVIFSARTYQHELKTCNDNLLETIECLKLKLFNLTGSIKG